MSFQTFALVSVVGLWVGLAKASDQCQEKPASIIKSGETVASQDAQKIAVKFRERGYDIKPLASGDSTNAFTMVVHVGPEMDCVLMLGIDNPKASAGLDLTVKDAAGNIVTADTRPQSRACVAFSVLQEADYEINIAASAPTANRIQWALLMGTRVGLGVAGDDAHKVAIKFRERGYEFQTVGKGSNQQLKTAFTLDLPKVTDCVILVGVDATLSATDLVVHDPSGNLITQDMRPLKRAAVEFSTTVAGLYKVTVETPKSSPAGEFVVLAGTQSAGPLK